MKKIFLMAFVFVALLFVAAHAADEPLKIVSASQADYSIDNGVVSARFKVEFNMPVPPQRLASFVSLSTAGGKKIEVAHQGAMASRTLFFSIKLTGAKDDKVILTVAKGLASDISPNGLQHDFKQTIAINPMLAVDGAAVVSDSDGAKISISTNQPVNIDNVSKFIQLSPATPFRVETSWENNKFFIIGDFKPRQRVEMTLKAGAPAKDGKAKLADDFTKAFVIPDTPPTISLPAAGMYLSPAVGANVPVETVNVGEIDISLWRLYESNVPYVMRSNFYNYIQLDMTTLVAKKIARIDAAPNEKVRRVIDLKTLLSGDEKRGVYMLGVSKKGAEEWDHERQVVSLTDIGVSVRLWSGGCLVWANSISSAKPIANAIVKIYDSASQLIAEGRTDAQGLCRYFPADLEKTPVLVTVSKNDDVSFARLQNALLNGETFDMDGRAWAKKYDGLIFTPRGIYRPGENVIAKVIVREAGNKVPAPFPVLFMVHDPMSRVMKRGTLMLSAQGGADIEYSVSETAPTGDYSISLYIPGSEEFSFASEQFSVESFAPPRIEVKLARNGEEFSINSQYLFGVPAAKMPYEIAYRTAAGKFTPKNEKFRGFTFSDEQAKFQPESSIFSEGNLDEGGAVSVELLLEEISYPVVNVVVTARVKEDSGRWIANQVDYQYFPNSYLLGLQANSFEIAAAALSSEEEPESAEIAAVLYKVVSHYNIVQIDGVSRWQTTEELNKIEEKNISIKNGYAKFNFTPPKSWGEYLVKIKDTKDENISASVRFFADSDGGGSSARLIDKVELEFDKPIYKTNETAKVRIKSPFPGTLLFTLENSKLIGQQVIEMTGTEVDVFVPLSDDMAMGSGNLWCYAAVVRPVKADEAWVAHRALGVKPLNIDTSGSKLALEIFAPSKTTPLSKMPVKIKAPAGSEVAVALVDDGVLQITDYKTPDPFGYFYARRAMDSNAFDIYDLLMQVEPSTTQALHPGGGMAAKAAAFMGKMDARRFKILSSFKPALVADAHGEVNLDIDIPEFSGRGRLFVVAMSGQSFASAERFVQIGRDVVIEPNLPRFAAIGDKFKSPLSVFNLSDKAQDIKLSLKTDGGLDISGSKDISVNLPPKSSKNFEIEFAASKIGAAKYTVNDQEIELPIRGIYPTVTKIGGGVLNPGETPAGVPSGAVLTVSDTPVVQVAPMLNYLLNYPYGCLEQTVSRAWGALEARTPEMSRVLSTALANIQAMQLYDGSFAMWAGSNEAYRWGSVYAAHFLSELRRANLPADVQFPDDAFKGVMNYLRQLLAELPDGEDAKMKQDMTAKAYASFVLALEKEAPLGWMYWLGENAQNLLPSGKIWLAGAYSLAEGKSEHLKKLGVGTDDVSENAQQLLLWSMVEPASQEAAELAGKLSKKVHGLYGTQENALVLIALSRYMNAAHSKTDKKYFSWTLTEEPTTAPAAEVRGLKIESVWSDRSGKIISGDIALGAEIFVSLRILPVTNADNVVVSALLPAGFEIESAPVDTEQGVRGFRREARDDRLLLFFDRITDSVEYKYTIRAVTPGTFANPPITAEGMYSPAYRFIGTGSTINIVKK